MKGKAIQETKEAYQIVCNKMSLLMDGFTKEHPDIQRPVEVRTYLSESNSFKTYNTYFELRIK